MSIGYLVDDENPMIWRGPMVTQALEQMLRDTLWRGIDYMLENDGIIILGKYVHV